MPICNCKEKTEILIVDDNSFNVVTLQTLLKFQFKLKADSAVNGLDAVNMVKQRYTEQCRCNNQNYKLIFMDCNMPIMDGPTATVLIKKMTSEFNIQYQETKNIYVAALTAYQTDSFRIKCAKSGMDNFLAKPLNLKLIQQILVDLNIC